MKNRNIIYATILLLLGFFAFSPTAQAITDAKAEDTHDKYKNVGTFIVIRGPNPIGLPEGIAATVTAVLIHERVLLSAGHFVARAYNNGNGVPFFSRVFLSFSPNALDESTWIPVPSAASAWVPHPSFPMPCSPQDCPFNDIDGLPEPGIADIGLTFLDAPLNINPATIASYNVSNPPYEGDKQKQVGYGLVEAPLVPSPIIFDGLFDGIRRIGMSTPSVIDENWNSYARDHSGTCHGDSGAPTFFDGEDGHGAQVIDIASDGNADCATGDVRARVDTPEVRAWIFDTIAARLGN